MGHDKEVQEYMKACNETKEKYKIYCNLRNKKASLIDIDEAHENYHYASREKNRIKELYNINFTSL